METTLAEVYATNIQVNQFKQILPQYEWDEKHFEEERKAFLWWLTNPKQGGRFTFDSQLAAWEIYALLQEPIEFEDDEEFCPSWIEEIEVEIRRIIALGNYNEYGGQQ